MITPPPLKHGDKIGIAAPARKISKAELQTALDVFERWGLNVVFAENLFKSHHQYAGTDAERVDGMQQLLDDESVRAIVCARGGYGTVRITDALDFAQFIKNPKWIAGYSDITVLHSHLNRQLQTETLHCTMPVNFPANTPDAIESMRKALFGETLRYHVTPHPFNRCGTASGELVGGNLSVLYALSASPSEICTDKKILFLEDLEEYLYHIDRMMVQLRRGGKLENLAGMIVGAMDKMNDNAIPFGKQAYDIVAEHAALYGFPLCFGFPAGHIDDNRALVLGRKIELKVTETGVEFVG